MLGQRAHFKENDYQAIIKGHMHTCFNIHGCFSLLVKTGNYFKIPGSWPSSSNSEQQESSGHPEVRCNPLRKGLMAH